jgi:2',3'-cyclic-nucleotide 2'-phosphodiesterase
MTVCATLWLEYCTRMLTNAVTSQKLSTSHDHHRPASPDMIVLFVGDVVGSAATEALGDSLPSLRLHYGADVVIVNAENSGPDGLGQTPQTVKRLLAAGADVITGGNHSWDNDAARRSLDHPRVLRPLNAATDVEGHGSASFAVQDQVVTVVNLADRRALGPVGGVGDGVMGPYDAWRSDTWRGEVIVDFHGDHVLEKHIFAHAVDGVATAVLGTHTHEPTIPLYILPHGTGYVSDVGMTGPKGGVQGYDYVGFVRGLMSVGDYFAEPLPGPIQGELTLGAVVLEIAGGHTTSIKRVPCDWLVSTACLQDGIR